MKNNASLLYSFFLIVGDFVSLLAAFVIAYILRVSYADRPIFAPVHARTYFGFFLLIVPFWLLIFAFLGLYNRSIYEKRF
ncbi:MAG TPA: sugar transferase, partial [Candidatus Limnocylindria bacterium]|nr:sugar transferase [Candidatus Limnocylindria bacterium]